MGVPCKISAFFPFHYCIFLSRQSYPQVAVETALYIQHHIYVLFYWYECSRSQSDTSRIVRQTASPYSLLATQKVIRLITLVLFLFTPRFGLRTVYSHQLLVKSITFKELLTPNFYHNNLSSTIIQSYSGRGRNSKGNLSGIQKRQYGNHGLLSPVQYPDGHQYETEYQRRRETGRR